MQTTRKRRAAQISPEHFAVENPFLRWYVSYWKRGAARCVERPGGAPGEVSGDIFMGELAASRFSVGVDDDKVPVLGVAEDDAEAVMSVRWASAAFLRRVQRRDWVALSCPDARIEGGGATSPVPLRLWLPATVGVLDGWLGAEPAPVSLRIVEATIRLGKPLPKGASPLAVLPLSFKGDWESREAA